MAKTAYYDDYARRKNDTDKKIEEALKAREERSSSPAKTSSNSSYADRQKELESQISTAMNSRSKRIQSSLSDIVSDIQKNLTVEIDSYNNTKKPSFGSYNDTYKSQRERRLGISKLRSKVKAYKSYLKGVDTDSILSMLDQMESGYDSYLSMSKFETEDEYYKFVDEQKAYEAMPTFDTKKGAAEVQELEKILKEYKALSRTMITDRMQERLDYITNTYGDEKGIKDLITKKKSYLTQAERMQEGIRLGSVGDKYSEHYDPEYDYWAKNRGKLPTQEDLVAYDSMMDQSKWYTDANGKLYDAYGTEIDPYNTDSKGNIQHPSQGSVDSSDKLGIFLSASGEDVQGATGTYLNTGGTWETIVAEGSQRHWDRLEENEINTYYYYLNKEGSEAAEKYLDSIQESLNRRAGTEIFKPIEDKTALELLFKVAVGLDQFNSGMQGVRNAITGNDEYIPVTATQFAGSMVQEDLGDVGPKLPDWLGGGTVAQAAGDFISTGANMLPSILTSTVVGSLNPAAGAALGTGLLSASAGGNAYTEMVNFGYDKNQARTYAAMVGASEAVLQSLLGGVSKLGGGLIGKGVTKALGKADNVLAKLAIQFGNSNLGKVIINAVEEGSEEYFQSILEPWFKNIIFGEENEIDLLSEEALYSALLGALTGGVFEASGIALDKANNNAMLRDTGKTIIEADGGVDALKAVAMDVAGANPKLSRLANKVSSEPATGENLAGKVVAAVKNSSNQKKVGKLYQAVESEITSQNRTDIAKALNENGFSKSSANNIADAIVAKLNGTELNKFQEAVLESVKDNKKIDEIVNNIINDPESGVSKRTGNMDVYSMGIMLGKGIGPEATREAQKTALKVSDEGKTTANGKEIDLQFADNGLLSTDNGTVAVSDAEYSTATEAIVVETIANLGLKADTANSMLRAAKAMNAEQVQDFTLGLKTAYDMGKVGNLAELTVNEVTYKLTSDQRIEAYSAGLRERNAMVAARQAAINEAQQKAQEILAAKSEPIDKSGSVIFENGVTKKDLSNKQRAAYLVARKVSSVMGNDIHLYSGKVEYGYHDAETGDVWLNINASASGKDLTLFTLSHEMTHHAREWRPEEFTAFADTLLQAYGEKGKSVEQMITRQISKAKSHGITLTRDGAYEEVISDACQRMLIDSNALEKLGVLEETNPGIIEKIKTFLQEFLKKIRAMFKDVEPNTDEAIYLAEMEADVKALLYEKFENLMVSTGKTYSTIKAAYGKDVKAVPNYEIITDGAVTIESNGKKYSIKSMKHDIAEGKMFDDLRTVCGWTEAETAALKQQLEDIVSYMIPFRDIVDMNETSGRENRRFSPYKPNSDPLYTISMDFSTLCSKRLLTQYVIENLQLRENRPMSAEEQIAIRDMLIEYRQQEKALQVACAMCYVEAARLKSPKQMERWLNDPASLMRNYFATQNPEFKQKIKDAQGDFKESRGYDRKATKKEMKQKDVTELNKIGPRLYAEYIPSADEQVIIDKAVTLPNSTYLTAGNLADLSESDPIIYKAYTSFVRTATRSKGLEEDIAYYYGDSTRDNGNGIIVSDSFIESVNNENGMRFSSWSDWRIEHLLDYITAVIDNSVRGAAMHGYTKFPDEVRVLGNTGMMFNMSGVAGTQTGLNEDGSMSFSETESINFEEAKALREEFPETAGLQCIGVGDEHIRQLLRSDIIDYVIPYHTSGLNAVLRRMVNIHGWKDYTGTQHATPDKSISKDKAKDPENWHKEPVFSEFFVGYKTGMTGVEAMKKTTENYIRMCQERGLTPKFAQFMDEDGYWKLLIDRKMVNNKTGELIQQKPVTPKFDTKVIKGIVDKYVDNYDSGLQSKALNHIVDNWDSLPARIKDLKKAKKSKTKKALDALANETVAAKPKKKFSLPNVDSEGNNLSAEQQEFFKDSQVRWGEKLMPVYHGTYRKFTVFDATEGYDENRVGGLLWAAKDAEYAEGFTSLYEPIIMKGYLNITNLLDIGDIDSYANYESRLRELAGIVNLTPKELESMATYDDPVKYIYDITSSKGFRDRVVELGYDGVLAYESGLQTFGFVDSNQFKNIDNSKPTSSPDIRYSLPNITENMAEDERYDILKNATILVESDNLSEAYADKINNLAEFGEKAKSKAEKIIIPLARDLGILNRPMTAKDIDIEFIFSKGNGLDESLSKQLRYGGNYVDFAKTIINLDKVINSAVLIEKHGDKYKGTARENRNLEAVFVLVSAFKDGDYVIPVQLEIKKSSDVGGRLYLTVAMTKIEASVLEGTIDENQAFPLIPASTTYNLADIFREINPKDGHFLKYLPDGFLSEAQKEAKRNALAADEARIALYREGKKIHYSLPTSGDISTRSILANAFESVAQTDKEREKLSEYKAKIDFVNAKEKRLREINAKLFQSTAPIPRDERIKLQDEAVKLRNQITIYDAQLLRLEASKPLQNVLNREKAKVRKQMKEQAKKDIQKAKQEEQQRYKERAASHDKVEMRKKIRKTIRDLDKILNHGNKKQNVKDDMKGLVTSALQAADVLFTENYSNEDIIQNGFGIQLNADEQKHFGEAQNILQQIFNLGTGYEAMAEREKLKSKLAYRMSNLRDAFYRERNRLNETRVSEVLGDLADAYYDLQSSEQNYIKDAYHASVHEYLMYLKNEVGGTTIRNMNMSQLENLHKAYTMVLETVRNANKMFNENLKEGRDQLANAIIREVRMAGGEHGDWTKLGIKRNKFSWNNMKPIYAAERIGSETFSRVVAGLFEGQYKWATNMEKARAFQMETAQKYGVNNWDMEKTFQFTSSNDLDLTLNLEQILALYAYSKRDAAHDHITNGGIVFGKNTEVVENKNGIKVHKLKRSATTYSISDTILGEIISKLDDSQKKYVDEMQKYLSETMGGLGNEVSMRLYGVKLFGEENYFPLKSAGQYMEKAREADLQKQQGHTSLVNSGFTHAVKPHAKNPIVLDGFMDVWAGHVNEMAMYNGMVLPMEDFRKVYNYHTPFGDGSTSVNGVIENAYGAEATGYFDQLYQELNSGAISDPRETDMLKWVGKFKKAAVMASMSVVVQQPSAIGRAFALIDPKYFVGQRISESDSKKQWDEVKKYAPVAIIKEMGGFDTHTGFGAKDYLLTKEYSKDEIGKALKDKDYRKEKADMIIGYLPAKADEITWVAIWQAVKREVRANNPKLHGEEFLKKAGTRFSEVIEKTQVYDSILARSANMRAKTGLMTMATAFMAEPTTTANMVQNAFHSKKNVGRVLASVVTSIVLNNLLASAIYAMRDDDEDETFLEKYAQAFTSGMVDDINPLTYLPFIKDVWSILQGYDVERSDMSIISDVSDALKKMLQLIGKDTSDMDEDELAEYHKTVWSAALSLADGAFSAMGVPFKNVRREVESVFNTIRTAKSGISDNRTSLLWSIVDAAKDAIPVVSYMWKTEKSDNLYDAIISGNKDYEERLRSEYEDEKQITNAIRKGLRENDSRIYEAALAQINGHPEERVKLQRQVIADGFAQDDVVIATNTIINKLSPSASTSEPKKKGLYSTEDFALFVAGGNTSLSNEAKKDIIATHQLNGKTVDEAEQSFQSSAKTDLKEMFIAGTVTVAAAEHALKTYCDMDEAEAKTKVNEWVFEEKYGVSYSDKKEAYLSGKISYSEMKAILMDVGGKTEEIAEDDIAEWQYEADHPELADRITYSQYKRWETDGKPNGVSIELFTDVAEFRDDGTSASAKSQEEVAAYINSLSISTSQKDALWCCFWKESTLKKAPWR